MFILLENRPINTTTNGTEANIKVGDRVYFSLKLKDISEKDPNGAVINTFQLNTQNISGIPIYIHS